MIAILLALLVTQEPAAIPTFECMGLEWPCPQGRPNRPCRVRVREVGTDTWTAAHDLWFDPVERQYRGSVVGLKPDTAYEFRLKAGDASTVLRGRTWSETFPVAREVTLPRGTLRETLVLSEGGGDKGYVLYKAHSQGTVVDMAGKHEVGVDIRASKVILQGVVCRGAARHGIIVRNQKDVVIQDCEVTGWGGAEPSTDARKRPDLGRQMDSGIFCEGREVERMIIQGNTIHRPRFTSNDWSEWSPHFKSNHPQGPKALVMKPQTRGNHVIRFNDFVSDDQHLYNDILLESNPSWPGNGLHRDSDIYGNRLSHCTDDAIEIERGTRNVRLWENYFDRAGIKTISVRPSWEGPYYIFRNVVNRAYVPKAGTLYNGRELPVGMFIVAGGRGPAGASSEPRERGMGYVYHNTLLCPPGAGFERFLVADFPQGFRSAHHWLRSRNNIATTRPLRKVANVPVNDFFTDRVVLDFDLYTGPIDRPAAAGKGVIRGEPRFKPGHGVGDSGRYQLADDSPGRKAGQPIPGFSGEAPDMGAQEQGAPTLLFGVARWRALHRD